jgi:hypothetical protein
MAHSSDHGGRPHTKKKRRGHASMPPAASARSELREDAQSGSDHAAPDEEARTTRNTERPVAHSVKPPAPSAAPTSSKRGFVWVAALVAFGVLGYAFRNPASDSASAQAARASDVDAPSSHAPDELPRVEAAPSPDPAARAVGDVNPAAETAPSSPPSENAATTELANAATTTSTTTNTAKTTSASARRVAPQASPVAPAPDLAPSAAEPAEPVKPAPFSLKAANLSLETSARAASSCRRGSDPSGVARAVVTFAPTGRVTAAVISGPPFAGTETGSCIARALRQTVIPAFEGAITTVSKTVEVH